LGSNLSLAPCRVQPRDRWISLIDGLSNQPLNTKSRKSALASPSTFKEQPIACDAGQIVEHFLALHKAKITARFETAMKDKRYGRDSAYTKDVEQKLGRSSIF
jgi:hypothetical protein